MSNETIVEMIRSADETEKKSLLSMLYENNRGLIYNICRKYCTHECMEDLQQEAFFGLRIAADMYDEAQGAFCNYAGIWIRQAVVRYIENNGSSVRFPSHVRNKVIKYKQICSYYELQFGHQPTDAQLMYMLKLDRRHLDQLKKNAIKISIRSLDAQINSEEDSFTLAEMIPDPTDHFEDVIAREDNAALSVLLWGIVNELEPLEADVIRKRFQENKVLRDVGAELGLTAEKVRQKEVKALRKLKYNKRLLPYKDEYISRRAYTGTGYQAFLRNGSRVEKIAIELCEGNQ